MDMSLKEEFSRLWPKYFGDAELPITFYFTDEEGHAEAFRADTNPRAVVFDDATVKTWSARCLIGQLLSVRRGNSLYFGLDSLGCAGSRMHLGFSNGGPMPPDFAYFISCGIPGRLEGERLQKSPENVRELMRLYPSFKAPARFIVFKRWDKLEAVDNPEVVVFFSKADTLAGLATLAFFDEPDADVVTARWGSGCGSIVRYPYLDKDSASPHVFIGMFDPDPRQWVGPDELTFAVPMKRFRIMVGDMEESFLITRTWQAIQKRARSTK